MYILRFVPPKNNVSRLLGHWRLASVCLETSYPLLDQRTLTPTSYRMMLLEQQNKKRLMAARMEQDADNRSDITSGSTDPTHLSEHWSRQQRQNHLARFLDVQELEHKARDALLSRASPISGENPAPPGNQALQDYQMQLMLLEQQNKKRLMLARTAPPEPTPEESD